MWRNTMMNWTVNTQNYFVIENCKSWDKRFDSRSWIKKLDKNGLFFLFIIVSFLWVSFLCLRMCVCGWLKMLFFLSLNAFFLLHLLYLVSIVHQSASSPLQLFMSICFRKLSGMILEKVFNISTFDSLFYGFCHICFIFQFCYLGCLSIHAMML